MRAVQTAVLPSWQPSAPQQLARCLRVRVVHARERYDLMDKLWLVSQQIGDLAGRLQVLPEPWVKAAGQAEQVGGPAREVGGQ